MGFKWSVVTNWNTVIYSDSTTHGRVDLGGFKFFVKLDNKYSGAWGHHAPRLFSLVVYEMEST